MNGGDLKIRPKRVNWEAWSWELLVHLSSARVSDLIVLFRENFMWKQFVLFKLIFFRSLSVSSVKDLGHYHFVWLDIYLNRQHTFFYWPRIASARSSIYFRKNSGRMWDPWVTPYGTFSGHNTQIHAEQPTLCDSLGRTRTNAAESHVFHFYSQNVTIYQVEGFGKICIPISHEIPTLPVLRRVC